MRKDNSIEYLDCLVNLILLRVTKQIYSGGIAKFEGLLNTKGLFQREKRKEECTAAIWMK